MHPHITYLKDETYYIKMFDYIRNIDVIVDVMKVNILPDIPSFYSGILIKNFKYYKARSFYGNEVIVTVVDDIRLTSKKQLRNIEKNYPEYFV